MIFGSHAIHSTSLRDMTNNRRGTLFAISKILLKLYGNFFNINRITNCISVLKEKQLHIGVDLCTDYSFEAYNGLEI